MPTPIMFDLKEYIDFSINNKINNNKNEYFKKLND